MSAAPTVTIDPEFRALIPPLRPDERAQLEANLKADGCRDPLCVWNGVLIDGHNRFEICTEWNIPFETRAIDLKDRKAATLWILRNQLGRRNLPDFTRTTLALHVKELLAAEAKKRMVAGKKADPKQNSAKGQTRDVVASMAGVSHDTVSRVEAIVQAHVAGRLDDETMGKLAADEVSINAVYQKVRRARRPAGDEKPSPRKLRIRKVDTGDICDRVQAFVIRTMDEWPEGESLAPLCSVLSAMATAAETREAKRRRERKASAS